MINQNILLKKLKSFPKHGYPTRDDDEAGFQAKKDDLESRIERLKNSLPGFSAIIKQFAEVEKAFNTSTLQLEMGIGKVIGIQQDYQKQIKDLVENVTFLERSNLKLNKNYGVSSITAATYAKQLRTLSIQTEIGSEKMMDYAVELKNLTSGMLFSTDASTGFRKELLLSQQFLRNNLEVSTDAAEGFQAYAMTISDSVPEAIAMYSALSEKIGKVTGQDALQLQKELTEDIGNLTADLQMRYNKIPGSLELAVLKSKALGTSLENLNAAGDNLLNIEQSIGTELEYQLLSGKRLLTQDGKSLTNAYRMAQLEGDAEKMADLQMQFIKDQGPLLKNNFMLRKKAAELLNTDEATISKMVQKQELMAKLGADKLMEMHAGDVEKVVAQLRKDGRDKTDIEAFIKSEKKVKSTAEIFEDGFNTLNDSILQLSGLDVKKAREEALLAAKSFEPIATAFKDTAPMFGQIATLGEPFVAMMEPLKPLIQEIPAIGSTLKTVANTLTELVPIFKTGTPPAAETAATVSTNDALIVPDRGPILRPAPNDVIAAFRPNDVIDRTLKGGGGQLDYTKMATAIAAAMRNVNLTVKVERDIYSPTTLNTGGRRV